ncbi:N-formylglutamate amidohydrolase [Desulfatiglans anilini]|uniref:N-formylglutamate amidohydrolase n=1 Tax=Desulfatiglans anilini TaxID=90728 RepID=UPI00041AB486|nr:N-formylglutamate amidohydrolase [Desulfatiglans anilini]
MKLPFVLSIPHGALRVPDAILRTMKLQPRDIEASVDTGTLEIFSGLPALAVVSAEWNRLVADVNRNPSDAGDRGVITRIDYDGREVYQPDAAVGPIERADRIERYHRPFHRRLAAALKIPGGAGLYDCHSLNNIGPQEAPDRGKARKDIVLGNNGDSSGSPRSGRGSPTCPPRVFRRMADCFRDAGFSVALNHPYAGGYITTHYGKRLVKEGRFAVQIEINQSLLLDPGTRRIDTARATDVQGRIEEAFQRIAASCGLSA